MFGRQKRRPSKLHDAQSGFGFTRRKTEPRYAATERLFESWKAAGKDVGSSAKGQTQFRCCPFIGEGKKKKDCQRNEKCKSFQMR